jgi:hypothetical protein
MCKQGVNDTGRRTQMAESKLISRIIFDQMGVLNGCVYRLSIEITATFIRSQQDGQLKLKAVVRSIKLTQAKIAKQVQSVALSEMAWGHLLGNDHPVKKWEKLSV